jgi:hypothetical protein
MGNKVVYFNGVRLWENLKHWKPTLVRTGNARKGGVSRRLGKLNPRSPNFFYEVMVHTDVKPVAAYSDLGRQETFNLQMLQVQKDLVEQSNALGDLAWCQDDAEYVTVAAPIGMPGTFPGAGSWGYTGAGYVPAAGQYALLRDPASGEGFVTLLTAAGAGVAAGTVKQTVTAGWEMVRIRFYFPDTAFVGMGGWETAVQAEDRHAFDVTYAFEASAHPVYPAGYTMDLS